MGLFDKFRKKKKKKKEEEEAAAKKAKGKKGKKAQAAQPEPEPAPAPAPEVQAAAAAPAPAPRPADPAPVEQPQSAVSGEIGGAAGAPNVVTPETENASVSGVLGGSPEPQPESEAAEPAPSAEGVDETAAPEQAAAVSAADPAVADPDGYDGAGYDAPANAFGEMGDIAQPEGLEAEQTADPGVPEQAQKRISSAPGMRRRSSGPFMALGNVVVCSTCSRELPVPLPGHPARVTCPFDLTQNEYRP